MLLRLEDVGHLQASRARCRQDRLSAQPRVPGTCGVMQHAHNLRLDRAQPEIASLAADVVIVR